MSFQRRLAIATDGFRGAVVSKSYINQTLSLSQEEDFINVSVSSVTTSIDVSVLTPEIAVEYVGAQVASVEIDGVF